MGFLVLGAGSMGRAVAYDLSRSPKVLHVRLMDREEGKAEAVALDLASPKVSHGTLDVTDHDDVVEAMSGVDVVISCVPYRFNYDLAVAAVEAGTSFCDLGGNNDIVRKELILDKKARDAGITIIPDCGLAPGLVSILAADALERMDKLKELHFRVGGLPMNPRPPLDYMIVFSPAGLINEYREKTVVIRHGKVITVDSMDDLEEIEFPEPFGKLEAFNTSGGTSTLPQTFHGKLDVLDYKTIRYPGHCEKVKCMIELGLFDEEPIEIDGNPIVPRNVTAALLAANLSYEDDDVVLLRAWAEGTIDGEERTLTYTIIDHCDKEHGITAMQRMTAYPASIVAQMMATGAIAEKGAIPQELVVPTARFCEQLEQRGVKLDIVID